MQNNLEIPIIWDWHFDEYKRIKFYIDGQQYIGNSLPITNKLLTPEGYWIHDIPGEIRANTIIYPCVKSTEHIKNLGYKYALVKDKFQQLDWGIDNSIILPPIFNEFNEPKIITEKVITMIHDFENRDFHNYELCKRYGIKNYGLPDNPTLKDESVLNSTKYLFHPKEIGYLCNAVIKAINVGTPIIFTSKSYEFGYKDYIKHPLIADSKEQLDSILECEKTCDDYFDYLKEVKQNILNLQKKAKIEIVDFLKKIW